MNVIYTEKRTQEIKNRIMSGERLALVEIWKSSQVYVGTTLATVEATLFDEGNRIVTFTVYFDSSSYSNELQVRVTPSSTRIDITGEGDAEALAEFYSLIPIIKDRFFAEMREALLDALAARDLERIAWQKQQEKKQQAEKLAEVIWHANAIGDDGQYKRGFNFEMRKIFFRVVATYLAGTPLFYRDGHKHMTKQSRAYWDRLHRYNLIHIGEHIQNTIPSKAVIERLGELS